MDRRAYLVGVGAALGSLSGCAIIEGDGTHPESGRRTSRVPLPVPRNDLEHGARKDAIPAITDPVFARDWDGVVVSAADSLDGRRTPARLTDADLVIGVDRLDAPHLEPRAYPVKVLTWHEVVNDRLGDPILVSFCPLCRTSVVADRRVAGSPTTFGVSGLLWRDNLVMYDAATESHWSQIHALAIRGVRMGERLDILPATLTTWRHWRRRHPETLVLRPPPESGTVAGGATRDYTVDPYADYQTTREAGYGDYSFADERLHPKAEVLGIVVDGTAVAYPLAVATERGVINDVVAGRPIVVGATAETLLAYDRRVRGRTLTFAPAGDGVMAAGGSRWRLRDGLAIDGPHRGVRLDRVDDRPPMFWFAWRRFHPETAVYGG